MNGEATDPAGIAVRLAHIELRCPDHESRLRAMEQWIAEAKGAWRGVALAAGVCSTAGGVVASLISWWLAHGG